MTYFVLTVLVMAALVFGASAAGKLRSRVAFRSYRAALAGGPVRPGPVAAVVMAAVGGGCLALLIIRWEDLAVLVTPVPSIRRSG
jgi:hypothetical protein